MNNAVTHIKADPLASIEKAKKPRKRPLSGAPTVDLLYAMQCAMDPHVAADSERQYLYSWTGTHYKRKDEIESIQGAWAWLTAHHANRASKKQAQACHAAALLEARTIPQFEGPDVLIPTRSCVVRIKPDGSLSTEAPSRTHGMTYVIDCKYEPSAHRPLFDKFISEVLPNDEVREFVQEYIGYTLIPDARYQVAQIWIGGGRNGKGTLSEIVQALHESVGAAKLNALDGFAIEGLIKRSLIVVDEAPTGRFDEQTVKSLISGDVVSVNPKHRPIFAARIVGKWIVCSNHLPTVTDQSDGFWRRWHVVPFTRQFNDHEVVAGLARKIIEQELSGVLNWALEGLKRLLMRGHFAVPDVVRAAAEDGRKEANSVLGWIDATGCTTTNNANETPKEALYTHYSGWCKANGLGVVAAPKFWRRIVQAFPGLIEARPRLGGERVRTVNLRADGCESLGYITEAYPEAYV